MDRRTLILLIIATIFLNTLIWSEPLQVSRRNPTLTSTGALTEEVTIIPTLPPEWETNSEQTKGIILGGVVLVLIIVVGSYSVMRRNR